MNPDAKPFYPHRTDIYYKTLGNIRASLSNYHTIKGTRLTLAKKGSNLTAEYILKPDGCFELKYPGNIMVDNDLRRI